MFTSRAENRLNLRADNADLRLTEAGLRSGLISRDTMSGAQRLLAHTRLTTGLNRLVSVLENFKLFPDEWERKLSVTVSKDGRQRSALDILSRPGITLRVLAAVLPDGALGAVDERTMSLVEGQAKYAAHIERNARHEERAQKERFIRLDSVDFSKIPQLSTEEKEILRINLPQTLFEASRLSGITRAGLVAIHLAVRKEKRLEKSSSEAQGPQRRLNAATGPSSTPDLASTPEAHAFV